MAFIKRVALQGIVLAILAIAVGVSYVGVSLWRAPNGGIPEGHPTLRHDTIGLTPVNPFPSGSYLVAILVMASDCGWATQPDAKKAIQQVRQRMLRAHSGAFAGVSVVGIAMDRDANAGLTFLRDLQEGSEAPVFDQLSVGGSWLNEDLIRLIWREGIAEPALPQVIVLQRHVDSDRYMIDGTLGVEEDVLRARFVGTFQIREWLDNGTLLPDTPG